MTLRSSYQTESKKIILSFIEKEKNSFTVKELYNIIKKNNVSVGLTTIYRFLEELSEKNILKKSYNQNNVATFQYLEKCNKENHFYLKCSKCGKLIHIDCDCIKQLQEHIYKNHDFQFDNKNIIIDGICHDCKEGGIDLCLIV